MVSAVSLGSLIGCGVEPADASGSPSADDVVGAGSAVGDDGLAIGTAESQLAGVLGTFHSCTIGTCYFDLGATAGQTCFLAGIWGSLREGSVSVLSYADGRYRMRIGAPTGQKLGGTAMCVSGNTHVVDAFWTAGHAAVPINGTVTSTRRCFLTEIDNNVTSGGFDNTADYAQVWKDSSGQWYLGGSLSSGENARAGAICLDIPHDMGTWGIGAGAGAGNTVAFDLAEDVGGVACGLTKLGGNFTTSSLSDGLGIDYNAGTRFWNIKAVNGKQAQASCVQ